MKKQTIYILIGVGIVILIVVVALVAVLSVNATEGGEGGSEGGDEEHVYVNLPSTLDVSMCPSNYGPRPLLLVSLDGFRPDYLLRNLTPAIQRVADKGILASYMLPSYPSVTFPNHYTIVTGLYPEAHGIIANSFYDQVFNAQYKYTGSTGREGRWYGGEPIWNTVTRQGKRSSTYFWPGSEAEINGKRPTEWKSYNESIPYNVRVLQVLKWLSEPKETRSTWMSLYFDEPDHASHGYGPNSKEVDEKLQVVDKAIDLLMKGLIENSLIHCVNLIILADHGGVEAGESKIIDLMNYLPNLKEEAHFSSGVVGMIKPKNESEDVVLATMRKLACKRNEMRVFRRVELPKRLHFAKNQRIPNIVIEVDPGYTVQFNSTWSLKGQHGYDNYFPTMHALFVAYGPDFKQGIKIRPFQNIEVYNLMCLLTGVKPAENNGTWGSLHHLLANPPPPPSVSEVVDPPILKFQISDLQSRWNASGCSFDLPTQHPWMSSSLILTEDQEKTIKSLHAPWGFPQTKGFPEEISLLFHKTHVTGFSTTSKMPLWVSFTLNSGTNIHFVPPELQSSSGKWLTDVRLPVIASPKCNTYKDLEIFNYSMYPLFSFSDEDPPRERDSPSFLVSNAIPVHNSLQDHWSRLMGFVISWTSAGPLNVILGSVFDENDNPHITSYLASGKRVPSDLFAVLTRCTSSVISLNECLEEQLDVRSLILHQYQPVQNCFASRRHLMKFIATGKDVERFSDLTLFPDLPFEHRINLTLQIQPDIWPLPQ